MQNLQNANNIDDMPYFCKLDSIDMKTVVFHQPNVIEVVENIAT